MKTRKIVVGVDGSAGSDAALEWAMHEAEAWGAELIAVHVVQPIVPSGSATAADDIPLEGGDRCWSCVRSRVVEEFCRVLKTSESTIGSSPSRATIRRWRSFVWPMMKTRVFWWSGMDCTVRGRRSSWGVSPTR
jgi:nucleotide-binding universal stress UspA family protein